MTRLRDVTWRFLEAETIHGPGLRTRHADNVRVEGTRRSKNDSIIAPSYSIGELRDVMPAIRFKLQPLRGIFPAV